MNTESDSLVECKPLTVTIAVSIAVSAHIGYNLHCRSAHMLQFIVYSNSQKAISGMHMQFVCKLKMNRSSVLARSMESSSREAQPLLFPMTSKVKFTSTHLCHCPPRNLCLPSKAAVLILLLTSIVGVICSVGVVALGLLHVNSSNWNTHTSSISFFSSLPYAFFALMMMFYPLSGFIADICCGRFKTIVVSLIIFTISILLFSFTCILLKVYAIQLLPCLLYTSPSPRDATLSRMPSSA